jgi:hypothetical protein
MKKRIVGPIIDAMKMPGRPGALPVVRHCPYCHQAMSVADMNAHTPACQQAHRNAPPQEPVPPTGSVTLELTPPPVPTLDTDLDNQELSSDPLQRLRQIDRREQKRIQRS